MTFKPDFNKNFFESRAVFKANVRKPEELLTILPIPDFVLNRYSIDLDTELTIGIYNKDESFIVDSVTMRDEERFHSRRTVRFNSDLTGGLYQVILKKESNADSLFKELKYLPVKAFLNRIVTRRNLKRRKHRGKVIRYVPIADEEEEMVGLENEQDLRIIVFDMESSLIPKKDISVYKGMYFTNYGGIVPLRPKLVNVRGLEVGTDVTLIGTPSINST